MYQREAICNQSYESARSVNRELTVFQDAVLAFQTGVRRGVDGNVEKKNLLEMKVERRLQGLGKGREEFADSVQQMEKESQEAAKEIGDQATNALKQLTSVREEMEMNRRNWEGELKLLRENVEEIGKKVAKEGWTWLKRELIIMGILLA